MLIKSTRTLRNLTVATGAGLFVCALSGCTTHSAQMSDIRMNPSPGLVTMHERRVDVWNSYTVQTDENLRMMVSDFNRFWLLDKPSRLSPDPMP